MDHAETHYLADSGLPRDFRNEPTNDRISPDLRDRMG